MDPFCLFAADQVSDLDTAFVRWEFTPRRDKSLPEMSYRVAGKRLNHDQAARYLALFDKSLDEFEAHFHDHLATIIDRYMGR